MTENRPGYLTPVPATGTANGSGVAEVVEPEAPATVETPGLTPPKARGHSGRFITDVIVDLGFATRERVDEAIDEARAAGQAPESFLVEQRIVKEEQLSRAIAERYGLDHVDLTVYKVDMGAANLLSVSAARRYWAVPVGYLDKETILIAMADPANVVAVDDIQMITGLNCRVAVASAEDIENLLKQLNTLENAVEEAVFDERDEEIDETEITELRQSADDAPVIKLVHSILAQAVNEGASDIHFETEEDEMRVRFRIDGVLAEAAKVPRRMVAGVVSRIKIMSELDIAEKRLPQDGRVGISVDGREVDLRIVTLPTQRGEGATIRILDKSQALRTLDELGLDGTGRESFSASFKKPHGAVLVTGPTGSGKSTTLYAALTELNSVEKNVITIEDPVEYRLEGINQINVNRKAGLTFAAGLRSILRADPDIIMVGEIRDAETARIAIEAALTGHMVLSTLHTNSAPGAIARLSKMGIESFLLASSIESVVAQRLARKLCPHCKKRTVLAQQALVEAGFNVSSDVEAFEPDGCARCNRTGYRGRIGLFSVMTLSERIKELTVDVAPESEIAAAAHEEGMLDLRESGILKVRAGLTSIAEVARVSA
jgi:type IV pilus assembly protein PilB